jgi:RNA polymerase sigma factor (sigma-70 family)
MAEDPSFRDLIRRVRAGDEAAATDLVRRYEPAIRRAVRLRLHDSRLGRVLDSMDICQSVLGSFFVRVALGQYELEHPEQLLKLLATMARNKLANEVHKQRAECRDHRRVERGDVAALEVVAPDATPSRQVAARELLQEARRRLSPDERRLLELREQNREWADIAQELRGNPEALRKKLARAVERVAQELGLEEGHHD